MNYFVHYQRLIDRARVRTLNGYIERHHVLPKCMGGDNSSNNLVNLTAEEHYVAHQFLVKMYPSVGGLVTAAVRMAKQCTGNKAYGWLRRRHAERVSVRMRGHKFNLGRKRTSEEKLKISLALKGVVKSEETRRRMSLAQVGNQKAKGLIRGPQSVEHRRKVGDARRGIPLNLEWRMKISCTKKGKKKSLETRARMSAAQRLWRLQRRLSSVLV